MSTFEHPLARDAKVWATGGMSGTAGGMLVIITTLHLDRAHKSFKAEKVAKLAEAAKAWVRDHALEAQDFVLVNRPKDWD